MVVDDFDTCRPSFIPDEANSPLIVDPNRMLPLPVCLQRFKTIARRDTEVVENPGLIQQTQLAKRSVLNVGRQPTASPPGPDQLRFRVGETLDHDQL